MPARTLTSMGIALLTAALLAGCASTQAYRDGESAAAQDDWDMAVVHFARAVEDQPNNVTYQIAYERARMAAATDHFRKGKEHLDAGNLEEAIREFQQTLNFAPAHQYAFTELQRAAQMLREKKEAEQGVAPKTIEQIKAEAARKQPIGAPPKLSPSSRERIGLQFPDATVEEVLTTLGKIYGITFLYDDSVRKDQKISPDFAEVDFEEALELIMLMTNNTYTVISDRTLMVYPDTQSKRREWEDQVIKTFYLSNADVNDVNQLLRTLIESRRISVNKQLNAISIRDTMDKIAIADQIIRTNDKAKAEVVIDVELLQVDRRRLREMGIDLAVHTFAIQYDLETLPLNNLERLDDPGAWSVNIPSVLASALKTEGVSNQLARPQVRVTEGEKVTMHIGDEVPIPNTTFNTSQTVGGNIVPVTSYTYQNVGIQITLEPRVHHNREVTLKMQLEVSRVTSVNSSGQPTIGTREVETIIRLKDDETNLLAGLLKTEDTWGLSGVPGLTDTPFLKRVFGRSTKDVSETDIVLTLTPHIIRIPDIAEDDIRPLWVGTERNVRLRNKEMMPGYSQGPFGTEQVPTAADSVFEEPPPISQQEILDLMRDDTETPAPREEGDDVPLPPAAGGTGRTQGTSGSAAPASGSATSPPGGGPSTAPSAPVSLRFSPEQSQVPFGGTVAVDVVLDTRGNPVAHAPYYVVFDMGVLEVAEVREGDLLRQGGAPTMFLHQMRGGQIIVGHSRTATPADGAKGSGTLATITFRGKAPGKATLFFTQDHVAGPSNQEYSTQRGTATITVQ